MAYAYLFKYIIIGDTGGSARPQRGGGRRGRPGSGAHFRSVGSEGRDVVAPRGEEAASPPALRRPRPPLGLVSHGLGPRAAASGPAPGLRGSWALHRPARGGTAESAEGEGAVTAKLVPGQCPWLAALWQRGHTPPRSFVMSFCLVALSFLQLRLQGCPFQSLRWQTV